MKKIFFIFWMIGVSLVVACNSVNITLHKKDKHKHAAKLEKKATKLEYQAAELLSQAENLRHQAGTTVTKQSSTTLVQSKKGTRKIVDSVNGIGNTYLHATDVIHNCSTSGDAHLHDVTIAGNCSASGDAIFKKVTVFGSLKTSGDATLDTVVANDFIHSGLLTMHNCEVKENATISGSATLINTTFFGDISLSGELQQFESCLCKTLKLCPPDNSTMIFKSSTLSNITVKHGKNWSFCGLNINLGNDCKKAILELDDTIVTGNIVFDDLAGTVIIRNGGQVVGQVIGGSVLYQEK